MKVLIIMAGFFPGEKYGGPPVSVDNFCALLGDVECYVVCKNHDKGETQQYPNLNSNWNRRPNCSVKYLDDSSFNMKNFENIVNEVNPDILYLQSLFQTCIMFCLIVAKRKNIKVLLAPRGELCAGAFKKKYKKLPYIAAQRFMGLIRDVYFQSTSDEETDAIQKWLGVSHEKVYFLTNIPSIPKADYVFEEKKTGKLKVIFLSRIHRKKNLLFALQCMKQISGNVQFDIYGPIEDEEYWNKCEQEMVTIPENIKLNYCGIIGHEDVHRTFAQYDIFFLPTLSENFGHVIAEALIVGCPVIISDQTPFNDVEENSAGWVIPLDNVNKYINTINQMVQINENGMHDLRISAQNYIKNKINIEQLGLQYRDVLQSICKNSEDRK